MRCKPLNEEQTLSNRMKSKIRARVEHVLGAKAAMSGHGLRTIGLLRSKIQIGLLNLVYNMKRLLQLLKRDANVVKRDLINHHRKSAPIVA
jgi:IS5 family transposase